MKPRAVANLYDSPFATIHEDEFEELARLSFTERGSIVDLQSLYEPNSLAWICFPRSNLGYSIPNRNIVNE